MCCCFFSFLPTTYVCDWDASLRIVSTGITCSFRRAKSVHLRLRKKLGKNVLLRDWPRATWSIVCMGDSTDVGMLK